MPDTLTPEKAFEEARAMEANIVKLARDLIACDTRNPPGEEHRAAVVVERELDRLGVPHERLEKEPGRSNVIGRVGRAGAPRLLVPLHLDTVPPASGWETDPFEAVVRDGRITGLGADDDKGPLAAALAATAILKAREAELAGEFVLVAAADEECGNALGAHWLLDEKGLAGDWGIVPDTDAGIDIAEKGATWFEVVCRGRAAHASRPEEGASAIAAACDLVGRLEGYAFEHESHAVLSAPTINIGLIKGGSAPNAVPDRCTFSVDVRYLPGMTRDGVRAEIERAAAGVASRRPGVSFEIKAGGDLAPSEAHPAGRLLEAMQWAYAGVHGKPPRLFGMGGVTIAKALIQRGVDAVGSGAGGGPAHGANESVEIEALVRFAAVLASAAYRLLAEGGADG